MYGNKLKTARFANNNRSVIACEWEIPGKNATKETFVTVSERDSQFKYLLTLTTLDKIEENTIQFAKNQVKFVEQFYKQIYENGQREMASARGGAIVYDDILDFLFRFNPEEDQDQEILFDLKLAVFEMEEITMDTSQNKLKESIRTAKSPLELINLLAKSKIFSKPPKKEEGWQGPTSMPYKKKKPGKKFTKRRVKKVADSNPDSEQT